MGTLELQLHLHSPRFFFVLSECSYFLYNFMAKHNNNVLLYKMREKIGCSSVVVVVDVDGGGKT